MRRIDLRWLIVFASNVLLWFLAGLANHNLTHLWSPFSEQFAVRLYVGGLLITFAALQLDIRNGFIAVLLTGLFVDAGEPVPFGMSSALYGFVFAALLQGRHRFPRDEPLFGTVIALVANLFLFLAFSFFLVGRNPRPADAWIRLFVDLLVSQLVLAAITPWFLALQARAFALVHLHPETGRRVSSQSH